MQLSSSYPAFRIEPVRAASRKLVRELGFMQQSLAGTELPPSAVHALIEIEGREHLTAGALAAILKLDKSSVSRMLRKLVEAGLLAETANEADARSKNLALTPQGREAVAAIHAFARRQVVDALGRLGPDQQRTVQDGLALYADALAGGPASAPQPVMIEAGYCPGLIGRCAEMHAAFYARSCGFGSVFEAIVAAGLAEFAGRLDRPRNRVWRAMQGGQIVGTVAVDGEDLGENIAHLRWFIVDDGLRGGGVGRRLLAEALAFCDTAGFAATHLWTFRGLDAARRLYEASGFTLAEEWAGSQWGKEVMEQRFVRQGGETASRGAPP